MATSRACNSSVSALPSWSKPGLTWAPTVARLGNQWVMYVSMIGASTGHCVDRLVSAAPGGPYAPVAGGPLVCDQTGGSGAIDPSVTVDGGTPYLYWRAEGADSQQLFGVGQATKSTTPADSEDVTVIIGKDLVDKRGLQITTGGGGG